MRAELARVAFREPKPKRPPVPPNWPGRLMTCPAELKTMVELNDAHWGWLSALKALRRNCALALSVTLIRLYKDMSQSLVPGPRTRLTAESSATLPTEAGEKQEVLTHWVEIAIAQGSSAESVGNSPLRSHPI
jgi:hypothetical protein